MKLFSSFRIFYTDLLRSDTFKKLFLFVVLIFFTLGFNYNIEYKKTAKDWLSTGLDPLTKT